MNNEIKSIVFTTTLIFLVTTSVAQNANSDLLHALQYSQAGANASSPEAAAYYSSGAFYNTPSYSSTPSYYNLSGYSYGSSATYGNTGNRTATNMSNVGLKINSSGCNRGAELARYYAEQRAERARRAAERRERMVADHMAKHYASSQRQREGWKIYIYENSHAKLLSSEEIDEWVSNGLKGNLVIDDDGKMYLTPEKLLEGSGETHETLEDKIKNMSDVELKLFAEELEKRFLNGEELTDEEKDYLYTWELAEIEKMENQLKQEEEIKQRLNEGIESEFDRLQNFNGIMNGLK